ncbi:DNA-binding SARP family transcriptional activator [Allocatelliglobosispora scoriae]|uniref:DNA-binding SARP family transcriptional activator n=1 Tax=Allocatelliglobosispora scoriae TaxID=643052 RepID=A0A841BLP2_9ACTN|nr:BTAD domain-containing putative transcriptional regulator [Allocatelliglobosispora scoriae]MBB5868278.1 DNA-binding SARP family transcriptional activator [Allocatelliglobosispora scoriae]
MDSDVFFGVLGPVEVTIGGHDVAIGGPRARAVLAALLLEANRVVPVDAVVTAAWGNDPPDGARFQSQNRVSALRRALRDAGGGDVIATAGTGYILRIAPGQLDAESFADDIRQAQRLIDTADPDGAAHALTGALRRWRGPALHGLTTPRLLAAAQRLDEARLTARELLIDVELQRSRHHEIVGELLDLANAHPWREKLIARLVLALYRSGRRREALEAYERTQRLLVEELGVDPGQELVRLRDQVLRDDPSLLVVRPAAPSGAGPVAGGAAVTGGGDPAPAPGGVHLIPRSVPHFIGRGYALNTLDALTSSPDTVAVCTIIGPPGVGKTALAVHWAHQSAAFPDGRLFVNLRGYGPTAPLRPAEGLAVLLAGLGTPPDRIPRDEAAAVARYRSLLADRRVLVVLDDASDADQVRPLLPPSPGSAVIVTSRGRLTGLTAMEGARPMTLPVLAEDDAVELLVRLIGVDRAGAERSAVVELARVCGRLPIALRIAAAQIGEQPDTEIAVFVADLRAAGPLQSLTIVGDQSAALRPALARSYARLDPPSARLFQLLATVPIADFATASAAALLGETPGRTAQLLERLAAACLVERREPDRFGLHDLVRHYAIEVADGAAPGAEPAEDTERADAVRRLFEYLVDRAESAIHAAFPNTTRLVARNGSGGFHDGAAALAWLDVELPGLLAVAAEAESVEAPELVWRLADAVRFYLWARHDYEHWREIAATALRVATDAGDPRGEGASAMSLGMAELNASHYQQAVDYLRQAHQVGQSIGWREVQAAALGNLGVAYSELGRMALAVESYRRALVVNDELGRTTGRVNNLGNLGLLQLRTGQFRSAAEHLAEAVAILRGLGPTPAYAVFKHGLGQAARFLGEWDEAGTHLGEALDDARAVDDIETETLILGEVALLHRDLGRLELAHEAAQAAQRLSANVDDPDFRAMALLASAAVAAAASDYERAEPQVAEAQRIAVASDNTYVWTIAGVLGADISLHRGAAAAARRQAQAARERAGQVGLRDLEGLALAVLAAAALAAEDHDAARTLAEQAVDIHRETGHVLAEQRATAVAERAVTAR